MRQVLAIGVTVSLSPKIRRGQRLLRSDSAGIPQLADICHVLLLASVPMDFLFTRIRAGKPTHLFTDEWRTPIEVEVLVANILALTLSRKAGIFHIAGEEVLSRYEIGKALAEKSGLPTDQIFPRLRKDDKWSHIRPKNLSLVTGKMS